MKKVSKIVFSFLFTLSFIGIYQAADAQCKDETGVFKCAEMFTPEGITFMNEFTTNVKKRKSASAPNGQVWDVYLLANRKYRFALCCYEGLDDIVLTLYDEAHPEESPIGSTFQDGKDQVYFDFICETEAQYKVSIRFKDNNTTGKLCAIGLLGYGGKVQ